MKNNEKNKLNSALATARQLSNLPPIAQDSTKKKEILSIIQNLEAAIRALDRGTDDAGRPITPTMIGAGMNQMLEHMAQHAIWFRLHVNTSDEIQRQLDVLQDEIKAAGDSLLVDRKKWWHFWK